jgi:hypothetical protein
VNELVRKAISFDDLVASSMASISDLLVMVEPHIPDIRASIQASLESHVSTLNHSATRCESPQAKSGDFAALLEWAEAKFAAWHLKEIRGERERRIDDLKTQNLTSGGRAFHAFGIWRELLEREVRERISLYAAAARESGSSEMLLRRRLDEYRDLIMTTVGHATLGLKGRIEQDWRAAGELPESALPNERRYTQLQSEILNVVNAELRVLEADGKRLVGLKREACKHDGEVRFGEATQGNPGDERSAIQAALIAAFDRLQPHFAKVNAESERAYFPLINEVARSAFDVLARDTGDEATLKSLPRAIAEELNPSRSLCQRRDLVVKYQRSKQPYWADSDGKCWVQSAVTETDRKRIAQQQALLNCRNSNRRIERGSPDWEAEMEDLGQVPAGDEFAWWNRSHGVLEMELSSFFWRPKHIRREVRDSVQHALQAPLLMRVAVACGTIRPADQRMSTGSRTTADVRKPDSPVPSAARRTNQLERPSTEGGPAVYGPNSNSPDPVAAESAQVLSVQEPQGTRGRSRKKPVRRNATYESIDLALNNISEARPKNHEEVFRFLDGRKVGLPNRKPFRSAGGWLNGFRQDRHLASVWLSQAWGRLGLPAFPPGPKE